MLDMIRTRITAWTSGSQSLYASMRSVLARHTPTCLDHRGPRRFCEEPEEVHIIPRPDGVPIRCYTAPMSCQKKWRSTRETQGPSVPGRSRSTRAIAQVKEAIMARTSTGKHVHNEPVEALLCAPLLGLGLKLLDGDEAAVYDLARPLCTHGLRQRIGRAQGGGSTRGQATLQRTAGARWSGRHPPNDNVGRVRGPVPKVKHLRPSAAGV